MENQPTYTNEDINQLLGLEFKEISLDEDENNELVFDDEPNEEDEPKRKSLAKNPLAKFVLIGGFLGIVLASIGSFVTVTGNLATLSDLRADKPETKEPSETGPSEAETLAALKAKAALAGQQNELNRLKAVDEPKEETPATPPPETKLVVKQPQQPVKAVSTPPPPQRPTVAVRPTPKPIPKPVARSSSPIVRPSSPPVQTATVSPLEQWQTLAQLGSYGGGSSQGAEPQPPNKVALVDESHRPTQTSSIIPRTQPVRGNHRVLYKQPTVAQRDTQNHNLSEEEQFLLGNTTSLEITLGQRATAMLESSLMWESNGTHHQNDFVERVVVTLTSPLTNHQGDVILPPGTPMLVAVRSVHDSGKVTAVAESVVKDGQEIPLPDGAIFLRDSSGNPLMAHLVQSGQRERMTANATTFVMGALSRTGELLNQGSTSTFISGGNFSQTQQFNSPNYIGGLLEGGFTPLAERLNQQHENRLSNLDDRTPLWMVEKGTTVEIFVNQTIQF